jgi:hypothetical protein
MDQWRIWTEPGGLTWADPGPERDALRSALEDCAETLSPIGEPPRLSTYWIDHRLAQLERARDGEIANGNLWTLTVTGDAVEVRMNVDPPTSPPLDVVKVAELADGLRLLREEVVRQRATGHALSDRYWPQRVPYP